MKLAKFAAIALGLGGSSVALAETPINLRLNPLALVTGVAAGGAEVGVSENVSVGGEGTYLLRKSYLEDTSQDFYSLGISTTYYPTAVNQDSFYVKGLLEYANAEASVKSQKITLTETGVYSLSALAGYQWVWGSGFNFGLGAGLATRKYQDEAKVSEADKKSAISPKGEIQFGWMI